MHKKPRAVAVKTEPAALREMPADTFLEIKDKFGAGVKDVFLTGVGRSVEFTADFNGRKIYQCRLVPELSSEGRVESVFGITREITGLRKAEGGPGKDRALLESLTQHRTEEMIKSKIEAEKAKRLSDIGTLAAMVAHELRNPLGVIRTAAYNIRRKCGNAALDRHIDNIDKKIEESNRIINNLLFFSRLKTPVYSEVMIHTLMLECIESMKRKYMKPGISVELMFGGLENTGIEADQYQLSELFTNIIDNAYGAFAGDKGKISIKGSIGNNMFKTVIEDNGSGINEDDLGGIFDPFFTTKSKGTGLGLTVCKQITDLHDGNISVESAIGRGTCVTIDLPLRRNS